MKKPTRYEGTYRRVEVTEGTGNADRFGREAQFLSHYGVRLAKLLREDDLKVASVDEGIYVNAISYPEGATEGKNLIKGIFSKKNLEMADALQALDWQKTD